MKKVIIYYNFVKIISIFEILLTQNPNPLMKHHFKKLTVFLYICVALIAYSCSEEKDIMKEENRISTVNLKDLPFLQKELNKDKSKGFYSKEDAMYYLDKINTENIIQIIDQLGIKSYTFGLNYRKQDTLFNLCAKETNEGYSYTLLKYSTTNLDEWIQDIKTTQKSFINPDIKAEPLDSKVYLSQTTCIEFHFLCPSGEHDLSNSSGCVFPREQWYSAFEIVTCNSNSGGGPGRPYTNS